MSKRSRRKLPRFGRRRRGLSELVGALFILLLLVISFGFSLVMFTAFNGYQQAVITRAQFNSQSQQQQLTYNKAVFGATQIYGSNSSGFVGGTFYGKSPANFYPLTNMNFTTSALGWIFTRRYVETNVTGISGNYDPVTSTGSPSGPGSVYSLFTTNPPNGSPETAVMNWTATFTISAATYNSLQNTGSRACFSWGSDITQAFAVGNNPHPPFPHTSPTIDFMLVNPSITSGTDYVMLQQRVTTSTDTNWQVVTGICLSGSALTGIFTNGELTYNLVIYSVATLKNSGTGPPTWKAYFDDVGVQLSLNDFYSSTVCSVIDVKQAPLNVQDLTFSLTSSYNSSVTQYIYGWDFAQGNFVQLDVTSTGTSSVTRYIDLAGLEGGASQTQSFIQSSSGATVTPAGCSKDLNFKTPVHTLPNSTYPDQYSIILKIYTVGTAAYHGVVTESANTVYYSDTSQFSLQVENTSTSPMHLVSLYVIGSAGVKHYASTFPDTHNNQSLYFNEWVAPGQTLSFTVPYSWTPGQYTIELVSDKGAIFTESVSAS